MPTCHQMKKGEVYTCSDCGLEMQVIKESCDPSQTPAGAGCFQESSPDNTLACCGKEMQKKQPPSCACS